MKKYTLTDEHRARFPEWAKKWIDNAMSTKPMDEADREATREAVRGMYLAANLEPPPDHRIVFVPSPFVLRFAGGFASAIWYLRSKKKAGDRSVAATDAATRDATYAATAAATRDATDAATSAATYDATSAATYAATRDATDAATDAATSDATDAATYAATDAATSDATYAATSAATDAATRDATAAATYAATRDATYAATAAATYAATAAATDDATDDATAAATYAATAAATDAATSAATYAATRAKKDKDTWWTGINPKRILGIANELVPDWPDLAIKCAKEAWKMWNGGNQWSGWVAYLTFFRYVANLALDYSRFHHYEAAAIHAGPRIMHEKFCMVSDRPRVLKVDAENRPHCEDGPFCEWSDGTALWAWHGTRLPAWIVSNPEKISAESIDSETNAEIRRIMIERFGLDRYLMTGKEVDKQGEYVLLEKQAGETRMVCLIMRCPTTRAAYVHPVNPGVTSVNEALAWKRGHDNFKNKTNYKEALQWER